MESYEVFQIPKIAKRLQLVILLNFCITDPPSPPQIHGDLRPEQRSGDKVKLTCITEGGNPLPKLSWLRNGLLLEERTLLEGR